MNFYDYSKKILAPLGVYDLSDELLNAELKAYSKGFEILEKTFLDLKGYMFLNNEEGLSFWENMLLNFASTLDLKTRKENILTILGGNNYSFKKEDILNWLKAFNISANFSEYKNELTVANIKKGEEHIGFKEVEKIFAKILPVGIKIIHDNGKFSWKDIEKYNETYFDIDQKELPWSYMETD